MMENLPRKDGGGNKEVVLPEKPWGWHYPKLLRVLSESPLPIIVGTEASSFISRSVEDSV